MAEFASGFRIRAGDARAEGDSDAAAKAPPPQQPPATAAAAAAGAPLPQQLPQPPLLRRRPSSHQPLFLSLIPLLFLPLLVLPPWHLPRHSFVMHSHPFSLWQAAKVPPQPEAASSPTPASGEPTRQEPRHFAAATSFNTAASSCPITCTVSREVRVLLNSPVDMGSSPLGCNYVRFVPGAEV